MEKVNRAKNRKYHYIYKITRFDGKYYIGMHSTDNLEDGYFGSGKRLWYSIKKYGKDKHTKELLEFLPSRESLRNREKELVCRELLGDSSCMNIALGGGGSWDHVNNDPRKSIWLQKAGKNGGFSNSHLYSEDLKIKLSKLRSVTNSKNLKSVWEDKRIVMDNILAHARSVANNLESIEKKKETFEKIKHQQGANNSQFGTCWITNGTLVKKVKIDELNSFIAEGYKRGRN